MLRICDEQMESMGRAIFIDRVTGFLIQRFPDAGQLERSELAEAIARQIEKAEAYGLCTERHATKYVVTAWLLGVDFDTEFPAAREVLPSKKLTAEEKVDWLQAWTTAIFAALEGET